MRELIEWLVRIESSAAELYGKAALAFKDDPTLSALLVKLSADERLHHEAMEDALAVADKLGLATVLTLGNDMRKSIEGALSECFKKIESGTAEKNDIMEFIVCSEFSEWNDIFLYVINTLKRVDPARFKPAAISCQKHKRSIERYFEEDPGLSGYYERIRGLDGLWEEKILVADDDDIIYDAIEAVLSAEGRVDRAANGKAGLDMIERQYYAVIISDIDMPVMDGMEFFRRAVEMFPGVRKRFIFFTGGLDSERSSYIRSNNLKVLTKPSTVRQIKAVVAEVLSS